MLASLIAVIALGAPHVEHISVGGGRMLTVTHSGSPKPGARVWTCPGPTFAEANALGTLEPGKHNPHSSVSASGASFTDPAGKDSGTTSYSGIKLSFAEGEKVSISLSASKSMSVGFRAYNCADGKTTLSKGASEQSNSFSFTFQPKEGVEKVSMQVDSHTYAALYGSWSWGVGWTFVPGEGGATGEMTLADAQEVHASFLMRGAGVAKLSKIDEYVVKTPAPTGIAADGASLLMVRAPMANEGKATFTLGGAGGGLYPLEGTIPVKSTGVKALTVDSRPDSKGKLWALALYRPPSYFPVPKNGETQKTVPITFKMTSSSGESAALTLDLVHPPIVLVHGTYDNPEACYNVIDGDDDSPFSMTQWFERLGYRVFRLDWEEWNGMKDPSDFQTNKMRLWEGKGGIRDALAALRNEGIVVSQADVICHSQGGVIARTYCRGFPFEVSMPPTSKHYNDPDHCRVGSTDCWYHRVDNYYLGDVHRLITISTTHRGSAVCNLFQALKGFPDQSLSELFIKNVLIYSFLHVVNATASGIFTGGFQNQVPDSLELQLVGPTPVPAHAIACMCTDEDMKTVRPDTALTAWKGNIPGQGTYWNNMWKIWMGTSDEVRDWAMEKLTEKAEAKEDPNNRTARQRLDAYRTAKAALPTNSTLINLVGQQLPESDLSRKLDKLFYCIRDVVFEGDKNDCTVAMMSSLGGLNPPYTFLAEHVLHGWAPRYKNVQRDALRAVECDGDILDPNGFPGYSGIKSKASTFAATIKPDAITEPTTATDTGNGAGTGTQGANTGNTKPPVKVEFLKLAETVVETGGVDMSKWTVDKERGTAVMRQPWATVTYKVVAPPAITKEGTEMAFEIEATPVPGQRVAVGMVFRGDEVKREPADRELSVYVESGTTAVTKKDRKVYKVSLPDYNSSNTIWVGMTDGPTFIFKYSKTMGDPNGGGTTEPQSPTTKPSTNPAKNPSPPSGSVGSDFSGTWDMADSFVDAPLTINQEGSKLSGTVEGRRVFSGTVEGRTVKFTYKDGGKMGASGEMTLSADGKTASGKFVFDADSDKTPIFFTIRRSS